MMFNAPSGRSGASSASGCTSSPTHLKRYLGEFDFRYNNRAGLGVDDMQRTEKVALGMVGKRLTYQRADQRPETPPAVH
jgi:hypothetical protein